MKRAVLLGLVLGALAAPSAQAGTIGQANYAQRWFESRPHALLVLCDSTPQWSKRKFPIYCGVGYDSGRWSDYRVRIVRGQIVAHKFGQSRWSVEKETCTQPVGGPESCAMTCDVPESPEPCPVEAF